MEPENPPTKLPRIAQHGTESRNSCAERGLPINGGDQGCVEITGLGLGLGLGCSSLKKCGFTFLQMRELEIQTLIYKYMEAGVPVPYHLIFPIWKSMSSISVTSRTSSSLFSNYRNKMDAEPRRCRRTDGKKWRCSKDVVSDHKYCQRHLHRGRDRARATSTNYLQQPSSSSLSTINSDTDLSLHDQ